MKFTVKKPVAVLLALVMMLTSVMLSTVAVSAATDDSLTVNVTSNIFPTETKVITDFEPYQDQNGDAYVAVEYKLLGTEKYLINVQGVVTWDNSVLEFKEDYNKTTFGSREVLNVFPFAVSQGVGAGVVNTFDDGNTGRLAGNFSSVLPPAYADEEDGSAVTVIRAVFRVLNRNAEVTVDCDVNTLALCDDSLTSPYTQYFMVNNTVINEDSAAVATCSAAITSPVAEQSGEEHLDPNLTPEAIMLTLLSNLKTSIGVKTAKLEGYENVYMVVTNPMVPNGETITDSYTNGEYTAFDFNKIHPQILGDDFSAVIYGTKDGVEYHSNPYVNNVRDYCYRTLDRIADSTTPRNIAQKALLVELLNYAAGIQLWKDYKTDEPANARLTPTQQAYSGYTSDCENKVNMNYIPKDNAVATWYQQRLTFDSNIQLDVSFRTTVKPQDGWYVIAKADGVDHRIDTIKGSGTGTGEIQSFYYVSIDDLWASQLDSEVLVTLYDENGNAISSTMMTTVNSFYVNNKDTLPANQVSVLEAMVKYGRAAKELSKY